MRLPLAYPGSDDIHCSSRKTKQGNSTGNQHLYSARSQTVVGAGSDVKAMAPEAERSLAMLRYAQSRDARAIAPFEATLGEIDCLVDLVFYHQMRLEDLIA